MATFSRQYLLDLISKGESQTVEFKTRISDSATLVRILSAFANTSGGTLIVGVGSKGEIVGISANDRRRTLKIIGDISLSHFSFPIATYELMVEGKLLITVEVPKAPNYLSPVLNSEGELYIRQSGEVIKEPEDEKHRVLRGNQPKPKSTKQECKLFVAMSFHFEEEPALTDYYRAMERAVKATNLPIELIRIDREEGNYEISQGIMDKIGESDIVLTDFTLNSANVYFELGCARGQGKYIIQTAKQGTKLEFDIRNWRTIFYKNATELEERLTPALEKAYSDTASQKS